MYKNKKKRNKITKHTRKYKKYYGGQGTTSQILNKNVGSNVSAGVANVGSNVGTNINTGISNVSAGVANVGSSLSDTFANVVKNGIKGIRNFTSQVVGELNQKAANPNFDKEVEKFSNTLGIVVKAARQPILESIDTLDAAGQKAAKGIGKGAINVGVDLAATIPGLGAAIESAKVLTDVTTAAAIVTDSVKTGAQTLNKVIKETDDNVKKITDLDNFVPKVNIDVPKVDNLMPKVNIDVPKVDNLIPKVNIDVPKVNYANAVNKQKGGFKQIVDEKYQIGGRINNSINEFINPINFYMMNGGNNKTKNYKISKNAKTKRVRFKL